MNVGTPASTDAEQFTHVSPSFTSADPSACFWKPVTISRGLSWSGRRPSERMAADDTRPIELLP
jgi:hypothetical protein